jgi:hypothetical protein
VSARVTAGRLGNIDLGKTVTVPVTPTTTLSGPLREVYHSPGIVWLSLDFARNLNAADTQARLALEPNQLVTITGKDQP